MAENLAAFLSAFYSYVILGDFVGKIVPGGLFLISVAFVLRRPSDVLGWLEKRRVLTLAFLAGLAWITALALQNYGESLCVLADLPPIHRASCGGRSPWLPAWLTYEGTSREYDSDFIHATQRIEHFLVNATEGQKSRYERFVIIKEAAGNAYMALLLAAPLWLLAALRWHPPQGKYSTRAEILAWLRSRLPVLIIAALLTPVWLLTLQSSQGMHWQCVHRQWDFVIELSSRPIHRLELDPAPSLAVP